VTVIDASVAVKWFVDEDNSDIAHHLLETQQGLLHIPDIFVVEVSAALVRYTNMDRANHDRAREGLFRLIDLIDRQSLILERTPPGQVMAASHLAIGLGHPLKDCIYLALAIDLGCQLVTADARFAEEARDVWDRVRGLGE
jgi:predicted nucleic acid-binding protein